MAQKFDENWCEVRFHFRLGEGKTEIQQVKTLLKELIQGKSNVGKEEQDAE